MRAMDVMTANVITVGPDTSVQDLAGLLSERGISGVPVVDSEERLVGIVSEGDLLHRAETGTDPWPGPHRSCWLNPIAKKDDLARNYVKSHGRKVKDIMTADVVCVTDTTPLADVAVLLEAKRIKRVPVVRDGKIIGIVSRANLVRALAAMKNEPTSDANDDDCTIRDKVLAELKRQEWFTVRDWCKIWAADVIVKDGVVHFWLCDDQPQEERRALRVAAENIAGVRRVEEHTIPGPGKILR
jgi:CBS domain-containing protein